MGSCKECYHYEVCRMHYQQKCELTYETEKEVRRAMLEAEKGSPICDNFKDRSRFVELPCKIGDTAWIVVPYKNGGGHFYTGIVTGVHVTDRKTIYKLPYKRFNYIVIRFVQTDSLKHINFNEIGKTIFFTKEGAEQALKWR